MGRRRPAGATELLAIAARSGVAGGLLGCVLFFTRRLAALKRRSKRRPTGREIQSKGAPPPGLIELASRYGLTVAGAMVTHRVLNSALSSGAESRTASVGAVGAAALWAALIPGGAIREGGCLVLLSRALMVTGRASVRDGWLPPSRHYATLVFGAACFEIMKAWFYHPASLPREYVGWISAMADLDMRLVRALRLLRSGEVEMGKHYDGDFLQSYVGDFGLDPAVGDPANGRIDCCAWHHPHTCTGNITFRLSNAVRATMPLYLAVHLLPRVLLPRTLLRAPLTTAINVVKNTVRSSAFLSAFIVSIWAAICGLRAARGLLIQATRADPTELDKWWDPRETWGTLLGCGLCGLSIRFEAESRRPVLALYVASRALASVWHGWQLPSVRGGDVLVLSGSAMFLAAVAQRRPELSDVWLSKNVRALNLLLAPVRV